MFDTLTHNIQKYDSQYPDSLSFKHIKKCLFSKIDLKNTTESLLFKKKMQRCLNGSNVKEKFNYTSSFQTILVFIFAAFNVYISDAITFTWYGQCIRSLQNSPLGRGRHSSEKIGSLASRAPEMKDQSKNSIHVKA